jgi:hypothetical protein
MRRAILGITAAFLLAAVLAGCRSVGAAGGGDTLPPPLPPGTAGLAEAELLRARDLYVAKCAKCHRFYPPANYADSDWTTWMDKMSRKSKLRPDQEELLSRYLGAFRLEQSSTTASTPR